MVAVTFHFQAKSKCDSIVFTFNSNIYAIPSIEKCNAKTDPHLAIL